jgi:hypothetical protein
MNIANKRTELAHSVVNHGSNVQEPCFLWLYQDFPMLTQGLTEVDYRDTTWDPERGSNTGNGTGLGKVFPWGTYGDFDTNNEDYGGYYGDGTGIGYMDGFSFAHGYSEGNGFGGEKDVIPIELSIG